MTRKLRLLPFIFSLTIFLFLIRPGHLLHAQTALSVSDYIDKYKGVAMDEMRQSGIPASIKLGQGILESGFGNSKLAVRANNHFGIKCHGWRGRTFRKDDDTVNECFRAYDDPLQSFRDHSEFLTGRPRYADLFKLEITDYKSWARGLRQAGYATNPRYPELLIRVIEDHKLYEFDRMAMAGSGYAETSRPIPARPNTLTENKPLGVGDEFPSVGLGREMGENNRIRFVYARSGDTPESLAQEMDVWAWEIYRYNDLPKDSKLTEGQIIYLQPKRRNASESWHVVQEGESLYDISQQYGVKLKTLYRRNDLEEGAPLQAGSRIKLKAFAR